MGELTRLLAQPTAEPIDTTTVIESNGVYTQARVLEKQPENVDDLLDAFGHDREKFAIRGPVTVSHRELVDGRIVSTYKYQLSERVPLDIDDLLKQAKNARKRKPVGSDGPHWFVFQAGDQQISKRSRDGSTEQIVDRYLESVEAALGEHKRLQGFGIAGIQLSFPGDCIEGSVSQGGKNLWLTQETVPEQTRILRRLLMHTVERFAPVTDKLLLHVVNGNHDQNQRFMNTYPGDGWATECAIAVDDALKVNPDAFGHVEVKVPDQWSGHMTVPVGDTLVTIAHGHQFPRETNAMRWWQEQAFNGHPPASAQVLQNGHFHEVAMERNGSRIRVQSPTFDMGSDWYRERHGGGTTRGALVYLMRAGEVSRLSLV